MDMFSSEVKIITVASKDSCNHHHHYHNRDLISATASLKQNYKIFQHHHHQQQQQQQQQQHQGQTQLKNQKNSTSNSNLISNTNNTILNGNGHYHHHHHHHTNNNRKKGNNNNSTTYSQLNNRKKQQQQQQQLNHNNNNKTIKNQNICSNEYAYNSKTTAAVTTVNVNSNSTNGSSNSGHTSHDNSINSNSSHSFVIDHSTNTIRNSNIHSSKSTKVKSSRSNQLKSSSLLSSSSSSSSSSTLSRSPPSSTHLRTLECAVVTLHSNPLEAACIVMNSGSGTINNENKISTTEAATSTTPVTPQTIATATSTSSTTSTAAAAVALTAAAAAAVAATATNKQIPTLPPASYSLDFLHAVGIQMTGGSTRIYSPPSYMTTVRKGLSTVTALPIVDVTASPCQSNGKLVSNGNTQQQQQQQTQQNQTRPTFKEYNFDIPPNAHPIRPYCHFIYPPPQGYHHPHHNQNINPTAQQYPAVATATLRAPQYHHHAQGNQMFSALNNNRNLHAKKIWHWVPNNNMKKCGGTNNNNNSNNNNHNSNGKFNGTMTNGNLSSNNSSQSMSRNRNQNNIRNNSNPESAGSGGGGGSGSGGRYTGNSRSPTPSPKSESPSFYKTQNCQSNPSIAADHCDGGSSGVWNNNTIPSSDVTASNSTSSSIADTQNGGNASSLNGYESDSSHSSYRYNDFDYNGCGGETGNPGKNLSVVSNSSGYNHYHHHHHHISPDVTSLINFPTYSTEENSLRTQAHYYGSQQNLTFWNNSGMSATTTTPTTTYGGGGLHAATMYSTSVGGTFLAEITNQYVADSTVGATTTTKRTQSHNRTYRGRRHHQQMYQSYRGHHGETTITFTPADRFLTKAHLIEMKTMPDTLLNDSKWDQLSRGVWEKFITAQQRGQTFCKKMFLWRYMYMAIKDAYPRYGLYLVGSTISGFGADTSDVDMCLVSRNVNANTDPRMEAVYNLNHVKDYLSTTGVFEQFNLIEAKVPILRFKDRVNLLEVDLNFNNCVGIRNTHLLHCYSQLDWRLRPLVLVTKLWAQFHNINNAKNMTISSYSLALMVIHFLQYAVKPPVLPCLHTMFPDKFQIILKSNDFGFVDMNEEIGSYTSQNTQTLGELFLQFLEYYSNFDYSQYAISVRTGTILPIETCRQAKSLKNDVHQWKELCIEEPFDLTNTARSVYDYETFERVKAVFITSWKILQETLDLNTIFTPFIPVTMMMTTTPTPDGDDERNELTGVTTAVTSTQTQTIVENGTSITNLLQSSSSSSPSSNNNNSNQVPLKITPSIS